MIRHGKQKAPHASKSSDEMDGEAVALLPVSILDKRDARPKASRHDVFDDLLGAKPHHNDELANTDRHEIGDDLGQDCALAKGKQRLRHLVGVGPKAAPSPSSDDDSFHLWISPESQQWDNGRSRQLASLNPGDLGLAEQHATQGIPSALIIYTRACAALPYMDFLLSPQRCEPRWPLYAWRIEEM